MHNSMYHIFFFEFQNLEYKSQRILWVLYSRFS